MKNLDLRQWNKSQNQNFKHIRLKMTKDHGIVADSLTYDLGKLDPRFCDFFSLTIQSTLIIKYAGKYEYEATIHFLST